MLLSVLKYLNETSDHGIIFCGGHNITSKVLDFVYSDFAVNLEKRRSIIGYVFTMYGKAMSWKASLQSVVALSTTEAEYIVFTKVVKTKWLKGLVSKMG